MERAKAAIRSAVAPAVIPYRRTPFDCHIYTQDTMSKVGLGLRFPKVGPLESTADYFRFEHETSAITDAVKDEAAENYGRFLAEFPEMEAVVLHIHNKRRGKVKLRAVHNRIYTLALGGEDNAFSPRVGASIEFLLDDMYYLNQFFDSKSGPNGAANIIAAIKSNDLFWPLLYPPDRSESGKARVLDRLARRYNEVISGFYYGEFIDCNWNVWSVQKEKSEEDRRTYCEKRTYYIDALFFQGIARMAADVVLYYAHRPVPTERSNLIGRYAHSFGMGLQIVNDVGDFVPPELQSGTTQKHSMDAYSDIRNGKMSYPVVAMLEMASPTDRDVVIECLEKGFGAEETRVRDTTNIFLRSGAYNECRALARRYKDECNNIAREFSEPAHSLLAMASVMLDSNRYYAALTELKRG